MKTNITLQSGICIKQTGFYQTHSAAKGSGHLSQYSDLLQAGRSGDRVPVGARFFTPIQMAPGAHPASYTMGTGSLSRGGGKVAGGWR
jgi:hypothetical protein